MRWFGFFSPTNVALSPGLPRGRSPSAKETRDRDQRHRAHEDWTGLQTMMVTWQGTFARIKSALMRRGRTEHEADDLLQEAWLRLTRHEKAKPVHTPEAFLMRTALNLSIDQRRAEQARGEQVAIEDVVILDGAPDAEAVLQGRQRLERLASGLDRLPARTREILLAHRLDGRSYTDIAQEHGVSINTIEKHIAKATLQLTSWMEGW